MLALFLLSVFLVWIFSWRNLFQVTGTDASCVLYIICSQFITCLLRLVCCIVGITFTVLLGTCPYLFLAQFDSSVYISLHQYSVSVALTCAKLALGTVIMSFHRWLSLLLRLKLIASGAGLTCSMLACRLLGMLVCITRGLYI